MSEIHHNHYTENKTFNFGKLFLSIFLIFGGLIYFAESTNWLPVNIEIYFYQVWPIIITGIGLSFFHTRNWFMNIVGFICTVFIVGIIFFLFFGKGFFGWDQEKKEEQININVWQNIEKIKLNIQSGGYVTIKDQQSSNNKTINGKLNSNFMDLEIFRNLYQNNQIIEIIMSGTIQNLFNIPHSDLQLELPKKEIFWLNINSKLAWLDLDLQNLFVEKIDINMKGSSLELKLGNKLSFQHVNLQSEFGKIGIEIPQNIGIKVTIESYFEFPILENSKYFKKLSENVYISNNFSEVQKFIYIDLKLGIVDLNLNFK